MRGKKKAPFGEEPLRTLVASEDTANPKVEWRYGACHACMGSPCPIKAKVVDGRVVKVEETENTRYGRQVMRQRQCHYFPIVPARQAQVPYAKGRKEGRR